MKNTTTILIFLMAPFVAFCQFPNNNAFGNAITLTTINGGTRATFGLTLGDFTDTTTLNLNAYMPGVPGLMARTGDVIRVRNTTANRWLTLGSQTLQEVFDVESARAVTNKNDTIAAGNNRYVITGQPNNATYMRWQGNAVGTNSNDEAFLMIDAQVYAGVGVRYRGKDPGFVRMKVENTLTPTEAAAIGISYGNTLAGIDMSATHSGILAQIAVGPGGNFFADSALYIRCSPGISIVTNAAAIRFRGGATESAPNEYGRFAATTGFLGLGTTVPDQRLTLGSGDIRIAGISDVSTPDSSLYIEDGIIKAGLASSGTVTSFAATDGNGFDFTVTDPTTTPTLTATTTVTDRQIMFSNATAIEGSSTLLWNSNNELQVGSGTDAGAFVLQVTGAANFSTAGTFGGLLTVNNTVLANAFQTTAPGINSNFFTSTTVGTSRTTNAAFILPGGASTASRIWINGTTATIQTAGDDVFQQVIGRGLFTEAVSGIAPRIGGLAILSQAITPGTATVDTLVALYVEGPPTGVTAVTAAYGFEVNRGDVLAKYGSYIMDGIGSRLKITEGTDRSVGQAALTSGTIAITINGVTTSSRAFVTLVSPSGTTNTTAYQAVCTADTVTIQANVAAGTINTADESILNYWVIN